MTNFIGTPDPKALAARLRAGHDVAEEAAQFIEQALMLPASEDQVERATQELLRSGPHMPDRPFFFTYAEAYGFAAAALDAAGLTPSAVNSRPATPGSQS